MSQWTHVDGTLTGVKGDLTGEPTPEGSEGGRDLSQYMPGNWMWHADLRDSGEEDAPAIRDWFADLCSRVEPQEATLQVDVESGGRYDFIWDAERRVLVLEIPPLYREAWGDNAATVSGWRLEGH